MILIQQYKLLESTILNSATLSQYINTFWSYIFSVQSNKDNIHFLILCKVQFDNLETRTLAHMRRVNFSDRELFIEYLVSRLGVLNDNYRDTPIIALTFNYKICDGLAAGDRMLTKSEEYTVTKYNYNNMQLPLTINPEDYGTIMMDKDMGKFTRFLIQDSENRWIQIDQYKNIFGVTHNEVHYKAPVDLKYLDEVTMTGFKRTIGKDTQYIVKGEVVFKEKEIPAKPFNKINLEKKISDPSTYCTIDIETVNIDGNQIPYLICGYAQGQYFYSYADDLSDKSISTMFHSFFNELLEFKKIKNIYAHNLSGFDGIFLFRQLLDYDVEGVSVKPILFNGKLMGIVLKILTNIPDLKNDKYVAPKYVTIKFKDSYLLLPMSLRKL